ncbi:MAG: Uma2 family endonuclease, partial [Gemmatimonadetes bacterium]|nr:Uma2 family endonuclease [Gemmatimonadota bacterium]
MSRPLETTTQWTYAEYARFPDDGNRYEVIDGEVLVTPAPSPRHQWVAASLYQLLRGYVLRHELGVVLWDVDLLFVTGQFLRPDMVFVPRAGRAGITDRG